MTSSPVSGIDDPMARLLAVMARLRDPEHGCPWDLEQDFPTIAPYTIEEAYEVADAIRRGDYDELKEELGDLLFQVVFYARMAEERGLYGFDAIAGAIADKMIARHPHVFADVDIRTSAAMATRWEDQKAAERDRKARRAQPGTAAGALDGVALGLPALSRALKLQKRAARVGFDWDDMADVIHKVDEELAEVKAELDGPPDRLEAEIGDLLFVVVNLARKSGVDAEAALRRTNAKFERRFVYIEDRLAQDGKRPEDSDLETMDAYWDEAKAKGL